MTAPAVFLRPQLPVEVAAEVLAAHGFTAAPVVDDDQRVVGIVTEADVVRGSGRACVGAVMSVDPVTTGPDADLADLVATMLDAGIRSVPVVADGRLVGVVTQRDVLRVVAHGGATPRDRRRGVRIERRETP
jgi:CBS domain-containing protein